MPDTLNRLKTVLADRYKLERHLGEGGMATGYLAPAGGARPYLRCKTPSNVLMSNELDRLTRCARFAALAVGTLLAGVADAGSAQSAQTTMTPADGDSPYMYLSAGLSRLLHPRDFSSDWQYGLALGLAGVYRLDAKRSVFLGLEHSSFSTATVGENPEIRLFTIIPGLMLSHPTHLATPYARLGAGLVRQGLRRMTVDDGAFRYTGIGSRFVWTTGLALNGALGATINTSRVVFPYVEASYMGSRASGVTVGHVTVRAGLAMSLGRFLTSIIRDDPAAR